MLVLTPRGFGGDARGACMQMTSMFLASGASVETVLSAAQVKLHLRLTNNHKHSCSHPSHLASFVPWPPCALLGLYCAYTPARLRLEQLGLALLNTFLSPRSASFTHRERQPSHALPVSFPEHTFLPQYALNLAPQHHRRTTHRLKRQNHDLTALKCPHTNLHSHVTFAKLAHHTDCQSKDITKALS